VRASTARATNFARDSRRLLSFVDDVAQPVALDVEAAEVGKGRARIAATRTQTRRGAATSAWWRWLRSRAV
jgi:hypothetical protein